MTDRAKKLILTVLRRNLRQDHEDIAEKMGHRYILGKIMEELGGLTNSKTGYFNVLHYCNIAKWCIYGIHLINKENKKNGETA